MRTADSISIVEMFSEIAVALYESCEGLSGSSLMANGHGQRMSAMFSEIETAIARLEPAEWSPGRYFDLAAETLLQIEGLEARVYAIAFRRAGTALLRRTHLGSEEFSLALSAIASGLRENIGDQPEIEAMASTWEVAATACKEAARNGFSASGCLQAASTAAQDHVLVIVQARPFAVSASLVIRGMRDSME
jgi:phosphoenolpyruvate---glycerone phosphotransferase subunit DhaL